MPNRGKKAVKASIHSQCPVTARRGAIGMVSKVARQELPAEILYRFLIV
jgi:hypothetical protein